MRTMFRLLTSILCIFILFTVPVVAQDDADEGTIIEIGQVITGEISGSTYEIPYLLEANAGDAIIISMTSTSPTSTLDTYIRLFDPNGIEIAYDDDGGIDLNSLLGPVVLPEDGVYTVIATRYLQESGSSQGTFELVVSTANIINLDLNETVSITSRTEDEPVFLAFTVDETGYYSLFINGLEGNAEGYINIEGESGSYIGSEYITPNSFQTTDPLRLSASDSIVISIELNDPLISGELAMDITITAIDSVELTMGEEYSGILSSNNLADYYSFDATAGELLRLEATQTTEEAFNIVIYNESGYYVTGTYSSYNVGQPSILDPLILPESGNYLIAIQVISYSESTNEDLAIGYSLLVVPTETLILEQGVKITGEIDYNNFESIYRYEGVQGETIRILLQGLDENYVPSFEMRGPSNPNGNQLYVSASSNVTSEVIYEVTLNVTGTYLIYVRDGAYSNNATFSLLIESTD